MFCCLSQRVAEGHVCPADSCRSLFRCGVPLQSQKQPVLPGLPCSLWGVSLCGRCHRHTWPADCCFRGRLGPMWCGLARWPDSQVNNPASPLIYLITHNRILIKQFNLKLKDANLVNLQSVQKIFSNKFQDSFTFYLIMNHIKDFAGLLICLFSRYPITVPRPGCAGNLLQRPGVRTYGLRDPAEKYDVYCFVDKLNGEQKIVCVSWFFLLNIHCKFQSILRL